MDAFRRQPVEGRQVLLLPGMTKPLQRHLITGTRMYRQVAHFMASESARELRFTIEICLLLSSAARLPTTLTFPQ